MADIAAAGYGAVQCSPANEVLVGENGGMEILGNGKWYYHYQPTDWKIGNYQLGTRDEFKAMCDEARKYNITVLVDVVPNHTTFQIDKVNPALNAAVGGQENLYHANGLTRIRDFEDRAQCTLYALLGLPDVNTENPDYQSYLLDYMNDLITCGARGFRYDAAKHIGLPDDPIDATASANNFWPIFAKGQEVRGKKMLKADSLFIYGEVLQSRGSRDSVYATFFNLTASAYGHSIREELEKGEFDVEKISDWQHKSQPQQLVTWVESHDTYCNDGESMHLTDAQIILAWAALAARNGGVPLFFSRPAGSAPGNRWGNNKIGERGNGTFKDPTVAAVNRFRTAMKGKVEKLSNPNNVKSVLQIERGNEGVCIINLGNEENIESPVALPDGTYEDQVSGGEYMVNNFILKATLAPQSVVILVKK
jgi:alpha-amylase